jgi:hypothetical protein
MSSESTSNSQISRRRSFKKRMNSITSNNQQATRKILLTFTKKRLLIDEMRMNTENLNSTTTKYTLIDEDYDNLIYFNNSIHDESYFCIAYKQQQQPMEKQTDASNCYSIRAVIFHTTNEKLNETIIKEYIRNLSRLNDDRFESSRRSTITSENLLQVVETTKLQKRACCQCPMQQYIELCEHVNLMQSEYKIYLFLLKIFDKSLVKSDQDLISDLLREQNLNVNFYNTYFDRNRLLMGLLHKLCALKQLEHLHSDLVVQAEFHLLMSQGTDLANAANDSDTERKDDGQQQSAKKREKFSLDNIHSANNIDKYKTSRRRIRCNNNQTNDKSKADDIVNLSDDDDNSSYLVGGFNAKENTKLSLELTSSLSTFKTSIACLTPPIRQQQNKQHFLTTTSLNPTQPVYKRRESMRRSIFNKVSLSFFFTFFLFVDEL